MTDMPKGQALLGQRALVLGISGNAPWEARVVTAERQPSRAIFGC